MGAAHLAYAYPANWPSTATPPYNLGGSINGTYTDNSGKAYDGTGYIVVDIDGAFRPDHPAFKNAAGQSKVVAEGCFGQAATNGFPSLCKSQSWVNRPLPGNPSAGYWFSSAAGISLPSDSPISTCRDSTNYQSPQYCHWFHGTVTSGVLVAQPGSVMSGSTKLTYAGVAPGAQVIALKVGGGTGTTLGWPNDSVLDALNYVNNVLMSRPDIGPKIVAVNISDSGSPIAGDLPCGTGSDGARVDAVAGALKAKGVAVVMSAGNDGQYATGSLVCGSNVVTVGATGVIEPTVPTSYSNVSQKVALFAPVGTANLATGDMIVTTYGQSGWGYFWGTSFSSPQVAAAFAVLRQKFGKAPSVDSLVGLMKTTGKPLTGQRAGLAAPGASVLNIKAALNKYDSWPVRAPL
ncbi:Subtilase family protein [Caballeronia temeraria]|uniref:Subtilase family protein n=2 Tax=Caballeronia temeraria TaxID=1777137 RepID=A0A158CZL4_9BURK|nr:Subtilase family protein [Caballeronia temeraria]